METKVNVDLNKCPDARCECGHPFFKNMLCMKRIPGIMAGSTVDQYIPINFIACELCSKQYPVTNLSNPILAPSNLVIPSHETAGEA